MYREDTVFTAKQEKNWFGSLPLATGWYNLWQSIKPITQVIIKYFATALFIVLIHSC